MRWSLRSPLVRLSVGIRLAFIWLTLHFRSAHPNQSLCCISRFRSAINPNLNSNIISWLCLNKCLKHFGLVFLVSKRNARNETLIWEILIWFTDETYLLDMKWTDDRIEVNWGSNAIKRRHKPNRIAVNQNRTQRRPSSQHMNQNLDKTQKWKRSTLSERNRLIIYLKDWWTNRTIDRLPANPPLLPLWCVFRMFDAFETFDWYSSRQLIRHKDDEKHIILRHQR